MTNSLQLPDPGPQRFWHGIHNPASVKTPLTLELRESTISGDKFRPKFSRLIAKAPTIADPKMILEAAEAILIRAQRVDEFVGVLEGDKE